MGDCKNNMEGFKDSNCQEKDKSLFNVFSSRKKSKASIDAPTTFASSILDAEKRLVELIQKKEVDLRTEKGAEEKNQKSLAILKTMQFYIDHIIDLGNEYSEL